MSFRNSDQAALSSYKSYLDGEYHRLFLRNIIIPHLKRTHILDIGCGTATLFEELVKIHNNHLMLTGVERDTILSELAKEKSIPNTTIFNENIVNFAPKSDSFDSVTLISVLHEIYSYQPLSIIGRLFRQIYQVLKKNGVFVLFDGFTNDQIIVRFSILNKQKTKLFNQFCNKRGGKWHISKDKNGWILPLTAAFDFIHKCYYLENWEKELNEMYYPLSIESYTTALYAAGFSTVTITTFPEEDNLDKIQRDFTLTTLSGKDLINQPCNCLIQAKK